MGQRFRVVLVGYGGRGRFWRTELGSHPSFDAVAAVDPDEGARRDALAEGLTAYPDLREALSGADADAALVASPPQDHVRDAIDCTRAGLAVLVEKPLATSADDAALVARQARVSGRPVLVAQNFRYLPREAAVRAVLDRSRLGGIVRAEVRSFRPSQPRRSWEVGPLWEFVLHHLDVLRVRVGRLPDEVGATCRVGEVRETWEIALRWAGGPSISYRHVEGGVRYRYRERIETAAGRLVVGDRGVRFRRLRRPPGWLGAPSLRAERVVLDEFVGALCGSRSQLEAADNVETIALAEAVARSAHRASTVGVRSPDLA